MSIFVDASALVAIIAGEADRADLIERLAHDRDRLWSAMSCWETVSALRSSHELSVEVARREVERAGEDLELHLVAIHDGELRLALHAYERYGRGRHRANLNMGDCFAYACARTHDARLLYKGEDFTHTDLA